MYTHSFPVYSLVFAGRAVIVAMLLTLAACGEAERQTAAVSISGSIEAPPGVATDGKVFVGLYHAWALQGDLRHAVQFIEGFESKIGPYSHEFEYPLDDGDGLLIYAWLDVDGDGVLCTPDVRVDVAGLTEVTGYPAATVSADIQLAAPCAGPDWFFP
jgi:hypothetical protein